MHYARKTDKKVAKILAEAETLASEVERKAENQAEQIRNQYQTRIDSLSKLTQ